MPAAIGGKMDPGLTSWTDQYYLNGFNSHKSSLVSKLYLSVLILNDMKNINFLRSWYSFVVITFVSLRAKSPLETAPSEAFEAGSFPTFLVLTPSILDWKYGKAYGQSFLPFSYSYHILLPSPSLRFPSTTSALLQPSDLHLIRHHK